MVHTLSSLAFKGSIAEAITEAKQQKKLFVVYVSGDNQESNNLETSAWTQSYVADSVQKFCILLHISDGSVDAANLSAICKHDAIFRTLALPCINPYRPTEVCTLHNSYWIQWHSTLATWLFLSDHFNNWTEGFVTADVLASNIEKAWLSLHIQETTATFLTAALASKSASSDNALVEEGSSSGTNAILSQSDTKQPASATSDNALVEEGSSSGTNVMLSQSDTGNDSSNIGQLINNDIIHENKYLESSVKETKPETGDQASPGSSLVNKLEKGVVNEDTTYTENAKPLLGPAAENPNRTEVESHIQKKIFVADDHLSKAGELSLGTANESKQCLHETNKGMVSDEVLTEGNEDLEVNIHENVVEKADVADFNANKSNDVYLNVRLPDGSSLQVKFSAMDTLRMVKDYVDENQTSSFGSYNLGIPYPRKVFSEQDLGRTLLELGLSYRQALIVVLNRQANSHPREGSSTRDSSQDGSSNGSSEGYWAYMRRVLSYMNPLSYLGGGSNSTETAQESQNSMWQYGPNPSLRNNLRDPGTYSANPGATPGSRSDNRQSVRQRSSRFGSNIHTLKHDEDDDRFSDRNAYWNGNSTQFGGDNDGK